MRIIIHTRCIPIIHLPESELSVIKVRQGMISVTIFVTNFRSRVSTDNSSIIFTGSSKTHILKKRRYIIYVYRIKETKKYIFFKYSTFRRSEDLHPQYKVVRNYLNYIFFRKIDFK